MLLEASPLFPPEEKEVVILRGIPGAGKSTYFKNNFENERGEPTASVCSADQFFTHYDPESKGLVYRFYASDLGEAHAECMRRFLHFTSTRVGYGTPPLDPDKLIVVDNTNLRLWEFAGYVQIARVRGYKIRVVRLECDPEVAAARCVHGVPAKKIKYMARAMEKLPKSWGIKEEVVQT